MSKIDQITIVQKAFLRNGRKLLDPAKTEDARTIAQILAQPDVAVNVIRNRPSKDFFTILKQLTSLEKYKIIKKPFVVGLLVRAGYAQEVIQTIKGMKKESQEQIFCQETNLIVLLSRHEKMVLNIIDKLPFAAKERILRNTAHDLVVNGYEKVFLDLIRQQPKAAQKNILASDRIDDNSFICDVLADAGFKSDLEKIIKSWSQPEKRTDHTKQVRYKVLGNSIKTLTHDEIKNIFARAATNNCPLEVIDMASYLVSAKNYQLDRQDTNRAYVPKFSRHKYGTDKLLKLRR